MEASVKSRMDKDLKDRLDCLYAMKMQPALHLSKKFDEIISRIDYDAEDKMERPFLFPFGNETVPSAAEINDARCEFVRILRALETKLHSQLLANEPKKVDQAFEDLEDRVEEFRSTESSNEEDMSDFEDSYVQLTLDMIEMTNAEECKIFDNQTVFYANSRLYELGSLFHLTGVSLTKEQIDYVK